MLKIKMMKKKMMGRAMPSASRPKFKIIES